MAIITLTTDYGNKDYFTAAIKGAILSEAPEVQIIDISHQISPFNIQEGAYILKMPTIIFQRNHSYDWN